MVDVPAVLAAGLVEPVGDVFVLVGAVVVDDEAHVAAGDVAFDELQEPQELLVAVPGAPLVQDLAGGGVERGEQRGRAVAAGSRGPWCR